MTRGDRMNRPTMNTLTQPATPASTESNGPVIHFPSEVEAQAQIQQALSRMHAQRHEHRLAAINGLEALPRLIAVLRGKSGQSYKLRRLLYSLWSGTPGADLSDVVCFDWEVRRDLCRLLLGWGFEDHATKLFYSALESALCSAGLMEWFRQEGGAS
jgi:hypothetical protein